jgi:hypothetical protein
MRTRSQLQVKSIPKLKSSIQMKKTKKGKLKTVPKVKSSIEIKKTNKGKDKTSFKKDKKNYVYLMWEGCYVDNLPLYKVGYTKTPINTLFKRHSNYTNLMCLFKTSHYIELGKYIVEVFKENYEREHYKTFYTDDEDKMKKHFMDICKEFCS